MISFSEAFIRLAKVHNTRTASEATRLKRVMARDTSTAEQVKARMSNQLDEEEKCKQSDFILYNDDDHLVLPQLLTILNTQLSTQ